LRKQRGLPVAGSSGVKRRDLVSLEERARYF
jgi:hypothetical protein